jgi:hypothetical protein
VAVQHRLHVPVLHAPLQDACMTDSASVIW